MDLPSGEGAPPARRRRGAELEQALLDAAWEQLFDSGYGAFTFEAVAERAGTSRTVVYRRWPDKGTLIRDAVAHGLRKDRMEIPDTGSLREDVLAHLRNANRERAPLLPLFSVIVGSYFEDGGTSMSEIRGEVLRSRGATGTRIILERAAARGEIDLERIPDRVADLPFDLFRHQLMMTMRPLDDADIVGIVDEVFLPLVLQAPGVTPRSTSPRGGGTRTRRSTARGATATPR